MLLLQAMLCNDCGYRNPISLARCPRCSSESLQDKEGTPGDPTAALEVSKPVAVPEAPIDLASRVSATAPAAQAEVVERPLPLFDALPPLPFPPVEPWVKRSVLVRPLKRPPQKPKTLAAAGGAAAAFLLGTILAVALSSNASPVAPSRPLVALRAERRLPAPVYIVPDHTPIAAGQMHVLHTRQGNSAVVTGRRITVTRHGRPDVVGTLASAGNGYVDVLTRAGRVRVPEAEIVDVD